MPALALEASPAYFDNRHARFLAKEGKRHPESRRMYATVRMTMNELTVLLEQATASVEGRYFQITLDGGNPVYRERVYCYELYHQLRRLWPESPYLLNGELDKAAHPILRKLGADYAKPDFLVHTPGHMRGNHAIIEVKSVGAANAGIAKDLETLALFRTKVGYQRAIYLLFGFDPDACVDRVRTVAGAMGGLPPIEVWVHSEVGAVAAHGTVFGG
jgi:hypothetical protein